MQVSLTQSAVLGIPWNALSRGGFCSSLNPGVRTSETQAGIMRLCGGLGHYSSCMYSCLTLRGVWSLGYKKLHTSLCLEIHPRIPMQSYKMELCDKHKQIRLSAVSTEENDVIWCHLTVSQVLKSSVDLPSSFVFVLMTVLLLLWLF